MAAVAVAGSGAGGGGSGTTARPLVNATPAASESRKRNSLIAGLSNSPGSLDSVELEGTENGHLQEEERRHPVKRACNECRQQKVRAHAGTFHPFCSDPNHSNFRNSMQGLTETGSFDAMSSKIPSPFAQDVADSISPVKSRRISSALARDLATRRWKEKLSN